MRRAGSSASAHRLAELHGVAHGHEQPVALLLDDIAVARDVRGHHGSPGREGLGEHHAEALTAERGRTEQVGLAQQSPLFLVVDAAGHIHPVGLEQQRLDFRRGAGDRQAGLHAGAAQGLEGAQEHRQPLAFLGAAHEQQPQLVVGSRRIGPGSGQVHAVGNDAIAASVEALGGPASGLGDRDPGAQLRVEAACSADVRGDVVGQEACGIRVERGTVGRGDVSAANQDTHGALGSWTWTTS